MSDCLDEEHIRRLLSFAERSELSAGGFGWLDADGSILQDQGTPTWIVARMTYVFALGTLHGYGDFTRLVEHGAHYLVGPLQDDRAGGWWANIPGPTSKGAYEHAFVLLAAAAASAVSLEPDDSLLTNIADLISNRFWSPEEGAVRESFSPDWETSDSYRGANANMHMVEAFLATALVTDDRRWLERALSITKKIIHGHARRHSWMLPEHYDSAWQPDLDYNSTKPADQFRPYGVTIGHLFEWARLCAQLSVATDPADASWLLADAVALYDLAFRAGWAVDGHAGFVYTVDWGATPVVRSRLHWVLAEAVGAASVLFKATRSERYLDDQVMLAGYAGASFLDAASGSWHHELSPSGTPASTIWRGQPDAYHILQAALLVREPLRSTLVPRPEAGA